MGRRGEFEQNLGVRAEFRAEYVILMSTAGRQNKLFCEQNLSKPILQSTEFGKSHLNVAMPVTVSFDQSQPSILTEHFEFDAYVSNPAQCSNVNYNLGTNHRPQK